MKFRNMMIPVLMSSILLSGCGNGGSGSQSDNGKMRKDLTAQTVAHEMGIGLNLGNTFESFWQDTNNKTSGASTIGDNTPSDYETCWGAIVTTQECIDGMKNAGFNTVRIPVYWGNMMADDGTYTINEDYMNRVQEVVDYCRNDGLYVVLNVHHYDEFLIKNHSKDEVLKASAHIWEQIADHFKGYSDYLVFEGYNEALGTVPEGENLSEDEIYSYVNDMNQVFVDTVRASGGNNENRILIASGYWTNIDNTTKDKFVMPTDTAQNKMMVSVHYIDNSIFWMNQIGNKRWLEYSTGQCDELKDRFTADGIPVFVGECTAMYANAKESHIIKNAEHSDSSECLQIILDMAVDYGFVPVIWDTHDNSNTTNFYSRTEYKIRNDSDQAVVTEVAERIAGK